MNELTKIIKDKVQYMDNTHVNDPKTIVLLGEIEELLQKDKNETISTLNELDLLSIEWISTTFEKVSFKLQSKEFVDCLDGLLEKFSPNVSRINEEIQEAKEALR